MLLAPPYCRWVVTMSGSSHLHRLSSQSGPEKPPATIHGVTEWLMYRQGNCLYIWVPHRPEDHTSLPTEVVSSLPIFLSSFPLSVTISWWRVISGTGAEMVSLFSGSEPLVQSDFFLIESPLTLEGPLASGALPLSGGGSGQLGSASFQVGRPSWIFSLA